MWTPKTVTVRRLVNTGNYENLTMELSAELTPDDNVGEVFAAVKRAVDTALLGALGPSEAWRISLDEEPAGTFGDGARR